MRNGSQANHNNDIFGNICDIYNFNENRTVITKNISEYLLNNYSDFQAEATEGLYSILSPISVIENDNSIQIMSDYLNGVSYNSINSAQQDSISYHDGRIYFYTSSGDVSLQNVINSGITLLYISNPENINVINSIDVYSNEYKETEIFNFLPKANSLNTWRKDNSSIIANDNQDGSFIVRDEQQRNSQYSIYQDINLEAGVTYIASVYAKGSPLIAFYNGNSNTLRYTLCNVTNVKQYTLYTYTFTTDRPNYRVRIYTRYNVDTYVKNFNIIRSDYTPVYITTDTNGVVSNVTLNYETSYTYSANTSPIEVIEGKDYTITRPEPGDVWQICYCDVNKKIVGYSDFFRYIIN